MPRKSHAGIVRLDTKTTKANKSKAKASISKKLISEYNRETAKSSGYGGSPCISASIYRFTVNPRSESISGRCALSTAPSALRDGVVFSLRF